MITVITEKYYPDGGGAELVTRRVVEELARRGMKVTVIAGSKPGGRIPDENINYINEPLLMSKWKITTWSTSLYIPYKYRGIIEESIAVYIPGITYPLIPLLKRVNPDLRIIVHMHNYQAITYSQFYIGGRNPREIMSNDYRLMLREYGFKTLLVSPLAVFMPEYLKHVIKYADTIIVPSKTFKEIICRFLDDACGKMHVVYNPVAKPENRMRSRHRQVIYLGGRKYVKGGSIALLTAYRVIQLNKSIRFIIVGYNGEKRFRDTNIVFYKWIPHHLVLRLLAYSTTLFFPSIIIEPCPLSVLEALHNGVFIVGFKTPILEELVGRIGYGNYLCSEYSIKCLIEKILEINSMSDDELSEESDRIMMLAKKYFDPDRSLSKLIDIITGG